MNSIAQNNPAATVPGIETLVNRFEELARQEKWFDIQDELFAEDVKSIEPAGSPYFNNATGKEAVRKKAKEFVERIEAVHGTYTSQPVVGGSFFCVGRGVDLTVKGHGHVKIDQLMVYQVADGKIISEQFFYTV